jgi:hypothetical protein
MARLCLCQCPDPMQSSGVCGPAGVLQMSRWGGAPTAAPSSAGRANQRGRAADEPVGRGSNSSSVVCRQSKPTSARCRAGTVGAGRGRAGWGRAAGTQCWAVPARPGQGTARGAGRGQQGQSEAWPAGAAGAWGAGSWVQKSGEERKYGLVRAA